MAQTKQGIHNSMLLECVSWDSEHVTLRNVELVADRNDGQGSEGAELVCTHRFCKANL